MFAFVSLLALAASVAGAPAQHKVPEPSGSLAGIISAEDYPPEALHQNEQGDVGVLIRVDSSGAVSDCTVEKSSGYVILDLQTCDLIRKRAKFQPARDSHGRAISSETHSHIHWRIAQDAAPSDPWAIRTLIDFGDDGKAVACRVELEGAMQPPPGKPLPPCSPDELKRDVSRETRFGGSIDSLAVEERFSLAPIASPQLGPNQVLADRYALQLGINADGNLTSCKVIVTSGPPLDWDPCTRAHKEYPARRGADGKAAPFTAFEAVSTVVDVDPKRMPLTGSLQGLVRSDDYPAEALDKNEQGTVAMLLRVDRA
ncbi:MAG: energy transducer TonB, partial [Sphingomicrobium sp.]